jgi:RNA polymerase sigma-70 factor (sigma-E family)
MKSIGRRAVEPVADRDVVLREVYRAHFGELLVVARWLLDEHGLAEEIVQEAFARTYAGWGRIQRQDDPLPYVRRTVMNLARSRLRRRAVERRVTLEARSHAPSAERAVLRSHEQHLVAAAVERLPRRQRECIVLRYMADSSLEQIADELGISEGAVKQHLHRARQTLARALADDDAEEVAPS